MADTCSVRGPAEPALLESVHAGLAQLWGHHPEVAELDRMLMETAVVEVVGNIVAYSRTGTRVEVDLRVVDGQLVADLVDDADELSVDLTSDLALPDDDLAEHGRGLPIAAAALDELTYRREGEGNHWHLARNTGPQRSSEK